MSDALLVSYEDAGDDVGRAASARLCFAILAKSKFAGELAPTDLSIAGAGWTGHRIGELAAGEGPLRLV